MQVSGVPCVYAEGAPLPGMPLALVGEGGVGSPGSLVGPGASGASAAGGRGSTPWLCSPPPTLRSEGPCTHLSDLLEPVRLHVGEDVALGLGEDLKGHGTVVVLQGRDVIVTDGQLRAGVDLVPGIAGESKRSLGHLRSDAAVPAEAGRQAGRALQVPGTCSPGLSDSAAPLTRHPRGLRIPPSRHHQHTSTSPSHAARRECVRAPCKHRHMQKTDVWEKNQDVF